MFRLINIIDSVKEGYVNQFDITYHVGDAMSGNVMIHHQGTWGGFCFNTFSDLQGQVLCRHLGYPYFVKYSCCANSRPNMEKIWVTNAYCNGDEYQIKYCKNVTYETNADNCGGGVILSCSGIESISCYFELFNVIY